MATHSGPTRPSQSEARPECTITHGLSSLCPCHTRSAEGRHSEHPWGVRSTGEQGLCPVPAMPPASPGGGVVDTCAANEGMAAAIRCIWVSFTLEIFVKGSVWWSPGCPHPRNRSPRFQLFPRLLVCPEAVQRCFVYQSWAPPVHIWPPATQWPRVCVRLAAHVCWGPQFSRH